MDWIPIVLFISITVAVIFYYYFNSRKQSAVQETLRTAINGGQALSPETIHALGVKPAPSPISDARRGVLLVCFGIAAMIFGHFLPDPEATEVFKGLAAFPILVGIGYFIVYLFNKGKQDN